MGLTRNSPNQKWVVYAFDRRTNRPKIGDAANITANLRLDGGAAQATDDTNPTEMEDGYYYFNLTQAETQSGHALINPESATPNIQVIGVPAVERTDATVVVEGTAQGGANNTITLADSSSDEDDIYNGDLIHVAVGTGAGQARMIVDYNGTTKVATVDANWEVNPDNTSVYVTYAHPGLVHIAATADGTSNVLARDVVGNKTDQSARTADTASIMAVLRKVLDEATEAAHHVHAGERWFGTAASPSATHKADRTGAGAAGSESGPIVVDAGNDDWGAWTQILGSDDTPVDGGSNVKFDLHKIRLATSEHTDQRYMLQFALQESAPADDPGDSDTYTETEFYVPSSIGAATSDQTPGDISNERVLTGTNVWCRARAPGQNTSEIGFYMGLHEYQYN